MIRLWSVLFLISMASVVFAQENIEESAKLVTDKTALRIETLGKRIEGQEAQLKRMKGARVSTSMKQDQIPRDNKKPYIFKSKESKANAIAKVENSLEDNKEELAELKEGKAFHYGKLELPPKLGYFGELGTVHVRQVIGPDSMLIRTSYDIPTGYKELLLLVKNVSTKGVTDKTGVTLPDVMIVSGTETYDTAIGGSNTVFVVEPMDTTKIEKILKAKE